MKIIDAALFCCILHSACPVSARNQIRGGASPTSRKLGDTRIINGVNTPNARYPYTASLQDGDLHFCGGSLIAPDVVLSAAHCARGWAGLETPPRIVLNPHTLSNPIENSQVLGIQEYIQHPFYQTLGLNDHNYLLIKLDGISSLPFVRLNMNETLPQVGSTLRVMGWGTTIAGVDAAADVLQQVDVVTISNEKCQASSIEYEGNISPDSLCVEEVDQGPCKGDGGGPLIIPGANSSLDVQVGIVSWGNGCAKAKYPSVYARVEEEYNWLRFQVCRMSSNPPEYFRCDSEITFSPAPTSTPTGPTISPSPTRGTRDVLVSIILDGFPDETGWRVDDDTGMVVTEVLPGTYNESFATVTEIVTLPTNAECKFTLSDSFGDGLIGRAVVYLGAQVDNAKILGYFDSSAVDTNTVDALSYFTTTYVFTITVGEQGIIPNVVFPTQAPSSPSAPPSAAPTAPTVSPSPTSPEVQVLFVIDVDLFPSEIGWFISQLDEIDEIVYQVAFGTYDTPFSQYSVVVPLREDQEYQLTLVDQFRDGLNGTFTVYLGNEPTADTVLAYYSGDTMPFTFAYTIDFLVSQEGILTGTFPTHAPITTTGGPAEDLPGPPVATIAPIPPPTSPPSPGKGKGRGKGKMNGKMKGKGDGHGPGF